MVSTWSNAVSVLVVFVAFFLIVLWLYKDALRADLRVLRWHLQNLRRTVFHPAVAKRRRDMLRTYEASVMTIDQFGSLLAAGVVAQEDRAVVLQRIGEARSDLLALLIRGLEDESRWLAEHILYVQLRLFSGLGESMIPRLVMFLVSEIDVLSDAPHVVDGHTLRLAQFVLIRRE